MDDKKFRQLVEEALRLLPKEFAEKLDNVSVTVDDFPTLYQMRKADLAPNMLLFGLYEGVPQTKRGIYYSAIPDKITIFKYAMLQVCSSEEEIRHKLEKQLCMKSATTSAFRSKSFARQENNQP